MEEMKHFSHIHPLKLTDKLDIIVAAGGRDGLGNLEKPSCNGCYEPIIGGSAYVCIYCHHYLHITCAQLEPTLNHHHHFQHPLKLIAISIGPHNVCDLCAKTIVGTFEYHCSTCLFDVCLKCATIAVTALHEAANVKFEHEGHPNHNLAFQLRPATFLCNACNDTYEDFFYQCNDCTFWIHKTCATLSRKIDLPQHHKDSLFLAYSLPDNFYNYLYFCEFCKKVIGRSYWLYHCANCRYFLHIMCALNADNYPSTLRDGQGDSDDEDQDHNILRFPMSNAFTDPLKLKHSGMVILDDDDSVEINHWSHDCLLVLNFKPQGNNMLDISVDDPIQVCYACVKPLSFPYYSCKDGCSFTLHKYCAELPLTLRHHQLHPDHLLILVDSSKYKIVDKSVSELLDYKFNSEFKHYYKCRGCLSYGNTFVYKCESCSFYLDVNCAFLPKSIKHKSHKHPLTQDVHLTCNACKRYYSGICYGCKACNIHLDMECAMRSPQFLSHRYCKGHEIPLTYPPVDDHPQDFYCDICESEMHPKRPLYHCQKCKSSFHPYCLSRFDRHANVKNEHTIAVFYHNHPLTFARRKKTSQYVCLHCNFDINGHLILECRTGTCPFRICFSCHNGKVFELSFGFMTQL